MTPAHENRDGSKGTRVLLTAAAFVIVVAGMRAAAPILVPFLLAAFIAIICAPPLFWLRNRGLPMVAALSVVIVGILGVGFLLAVIIGASIRDFSSELPLYQARLQLQITALLDWLRGAGVQISDQILLEYFDPGAVMQFVGSTLGRVGGLLTNGFLILLTIAFILLEASSFPTKLRSILGSSNPSFAHADTVINNVQRYMAKKTLISLATGITVSVWVAVIGVDYALLWGLLAFALNFVPNIGSFLAAIPAVLFALIQLGLKSALFAALGFTIVNIVFGNLIEPRYLGRGLGLSALVVYLSLIFWGWVLGPIGMLLSVPLTMTVKIALESNEDTRWVGILLGTEAAAKAASSAPPQKSHSETPETKRSE